MKKIHLTLLASVLWGVPELLTAQVQQTRQEQDSIQTAGTERIDMSQIKKGLVNNAFDALSGTSAGVNVTTNGLDRMAMLNSIRVRGTTSVTGGNDPLVIIDGVTGNLESLSAIYPADIESFTILKNASETALYGSRGASGVIEVKTKKGTGRGFQISYDGNYGFESAYKRIETLSAAEYIATAKRLQIDYNDGGHNTDYYKVITRTGSLQNHHLAFSGGNATSNYRASFGYLDHQSIVRTKGYKNLVVKLDISQKAFGDRLTGDFGAFGSSFKNQGIFDTQMLFYSAATQNPTYPAGKNESGNWIKNSAASQINHPGALLEEKNDQKDLSFNTHLRLTYNFTPHLKLSAFGSYSYQSTENAQFCPTWVWAQGNVYRGEFKNANWLGNLALSYDHTWRSHHLSASVSAEYNKQTQTGFWVQTKDITTNSFGYENIGASASRPYGGTGSSYEAPSLASVMGTATYRYTDRYALTLTLRSDGSSMVGENHTWGFFPSISAEWNILKEAFMRRQKVLSMLKLHAGYGESGNLGGISSYTTLNTAKQTGVVSINGKPTMTLGAVRNNNPDLKWETRSTVNAGIDLGLWNNRLILTAEYYYSKTTDMLYAYDVPVPPFAYDKLLANIGSMSNRGLEVGFSITPLQKKDMELNANFNVSFQQNKLLSLSGEYNGMTMSAANITSIGSLSGAGQHGGYNNVVYQIVGQPLGVFYLPHCTGLEKDEAGHYRYALADLNNDGTVDISDGGDRYIAGQATPKVTLGSNISFRYRCLYASLQINGAFGHKIFNGTSLAYYNMSSFPDYNVMKDAPEKDIVDQNVSDYWLESGNYVNFENLTLGCDIPVRSKVVRSLRVSCSVNNLATITAYSGLTPMVNSYVVNSTLGIDDKRTCPIYRTYSVGLSIQF